MNLTSLLFALSIFVYTQTFAMSTQEVIKTSNEVSSLLDKTRKLGDKGDVKGACFYSRKAINLFTTIDPDKDLQTAGEKQSYSNAANSILFVFQSMKGVCF
jgi:hypothetical protein